MSRSQKSDDGWPLIEEVLSPRTAEVHPAIVDFYNNPARYRVTVSVDLRTLPARLWSRIGTLLIGQGLYESDQEVIEARFRVFRRDDGSMHFIRELYCGGTYRVFDSDFVVRDVAGHPTLFEVFLDLGAEVEMDVAPLPGGELSIKSRNIYLHGGRLPHVGLQVEFRSQSRHIRTASTSCTFVASSRWRRGPVLEESSRFDLRRPVDLASIHYPARAS